jgi:hypothetical protein
MNQCFLRVAQELQERLRGEDEAVLAVYGGHALCAVGSAKEEGPQAWPAADPLRKIRYKGLGHASTMVIKLRKDVWDKIVPNEAA